MATINSWGSNIPVEETLGGTNQTGYTKGDTLHADATDSLDKLGIGTEGQVYAVSALGVPEWITLAGGMGATDWTLIATDSPNAVSSIERTTGLGTAYEDYMIVIEDIYADDTNAQLTMELSDDGGSTYAVNMRGMEISRDGVRGDIVTSHSHPYIDLGAIKSTSGPNNLVARWTGNKTSSYKHLEVVARMMYSITTLNVMYQLIIETNGDIDGVKFHCDSDLFQNGTITYYGR